MELSYMVLDGNMKNHRDVCYAKDAGFIEFEGLKGLIKTGCAAAPKVNIIVISIRTKHATYSIQIRYIQKIWVYRQGLNYTTEVV